MYVCMYVSSNVPLIVSPHVLQPKLLVHAHVVIRASLRIFLFILHPGLNYREERENCVQYINIFTLRTSRRTRTLAYIPNGKNKYII